MFDMSKRGGAPRSHDEPGVDDELETDRFSAPRPAPAPSPGNARVREAAIIGPSIHIDGDLRGEEDLMIEGTVTGTVQLREHTLTIGANGKVRADVHADSIFVDGTLEGDLYGSDRVAIRKNGSVKGNIVSPRISLDDGARFKGSVEMDEQAVDAAFGRSGSRAAAGSSAGTRPSSAGEPGKSASDSAKTAGKSGTSDSVSASSSSAASAGNASAGKS